jgi:dihydrofolate reductase
MRKTIVSARISMDGVMEEPMESTEEFSLGGWARAYQDEDCWVEFDRLYFGEKFDLLLGRKTYEIFAGYWPQQVWADAPNGGLPKVFNAIKKYVISRSGEVDLTWQGSVLLRDIAEVKRLREEEGPALLVLGSTELVHALLADDLVDVLNVFTIPVVLGRGKKLFADGSVPGAYKLTRSRVSRSGVMIGYYERNGEIQRGDTAPS